MLFLIFSCQEEGVLTRSVGDTEIASNAILKYILNLQKLKNHGIIFLVCHYSTPLEILRNALLNDKYALYKLNTHKNKKSNNDKKRIQW